MTKSTSPYCAKYGVSDWLGLVCHDLLHRSRSVCGSNVVNTGQQELIPLTACFKPDMSGSKKLCHLST